MIEFAHIITADDPFGEPWPPDGSCSIVRRSSSGFTLWRCTRAHVTPPASRASSLGGNEDIMNDHQKPQTLKTEREEMKPETESSALPAVQPHTTETLVQLDADVVALATEARELSESDIRAKLKFKKGKWSKETVDGQDTKAGATTKYAVDMLSYERKWVEWRDRKPVRKFGGRPIDGFVSPMRDRLLDRDEAGWPRDAKGAPQDFWQENFSIVMRDLDDDRLYTWTTTSWYGSRALGALLKTYVGQHKQHPGCMPVVLLLSETKPTTSYGDVEAPVLKIIDWQPFGDGAAPPGMRNLPPPVWPPVQQVLPPKASLSQDMGEELSF